jgi:hypothetical protein
MHLLNRDIPYLRTGAIAKEELVIDMYIQKRPLVLNINLPERIFSVFLKEIPKAKHEHYKQHGIPYGKDGIYTLRLKK